MIGISAHMHEYVLEEKQFCKDTELQGQKQIWYIIRWLLSSMDISSMGISVLLKLAFEGFISFILETKHGDGHQHSIVCIKISNIAIPYKLVFNTKSVVPTYAFVR